MSNWPSRKPDHMICLFAWFRPIFEKWFNLAVVDIVSCNVLICNRCSHCQEATWPVLDIHQVTFWRCNCCYADDRWEQGQQWAKKKEFSFYGVNFMIWPVEGKYRMKTIRKAWLRVNLVFNCIHPNLRAVQSSLLTVIHNNYVTTQMDSDRMDRTGLLPHWLGNTK